MKFERLKPPEETAIARKPKEQLVLARPTKSMSVCEMRKEIEKAGLRPATLEELVDVVTSHEKSRRAGRVERDGGDIIVEGQEVTEERKRLAGKEE